MDMTDIPLMTPRAAAEALAAFEARTHGNHGPTLFAVNIRPGLVLANHLEARDVFRRYAAATVFNQVVPRVAALRQARDMGRLYGFPDPRYGWGGVAWLEDQPVDFLLVGNADTGRAG